MSILHKVIKDIRFEIPTDVLEIAFLGRRGRERLSPGSLDWEVRNKVIDAKVRPDCDLLGALEINIPLRQAEIINDPSGDYRTVVRIPKFLTQGRTIVEALYFNYTYNLGAQTMIGGTLNNDYSMNNCGNSQLMNYASKILTSAAPGGLTGSAAVTLIGENTIMITDYMGSVKQGSITCRVSHDADMNTLPPRAVPQFVQLCVYATKAWIYNNVKVKLNQGYLEGGSEMPVIQEFVDGYSDAAELYKEYFREEWTAVQMMSDNAAHGNYLRNLIGGLF
ncbi:hypothetical protein TOTORO_00280 [Serratia phage vB_SmaS-Totoro]|nr:hypothetical protein TOTORO_00280 [Serratia phage vB_SmaS-Totoro]